MVLLLKMIIEDNSKEKYDCREEIYMFKIGFLGAGTIASKVAETIMKLEDFQVYAVASRSEERAGEFAKKYHAVKIYTDYVELTRMWI